MSTSPTFSYFELAGSPEEIGAKAGRLFGDRISATYDFYEKLFAELLKVEMTDAAKLSHLRSEMEQAANSFEKSVSKLLPECHEEIVSMASAANLPIWKLYVLNARTEVYRMLVPRATSGQGAGSAQDDGECTALYFPHSGVLGQNWDWHPALEELSIVVKVSPRNKPSMIMLTEPGIIGKIGLNSEGLGVCLNILFAPCEFKGIPIHVLLRSVLESSNVTQATSLIERMPRGTVSNMLIADISGAAVDLELLGEKLIKVALPEGELIHTNHYFADEKGASAAVPGSVYRLARARELYRAYSERGVDGMKQILSDSNHPEYPICRNYARGVDFVVGTVAGLIMELKNRVLHVAKGQPSRNAVWKTHHLI